MSEDRDVRTVLEGETGASLAAAARLLDRDRAAELVEAMLAVVSGEPTWERARVLERLRQLPDGTPLLVPLASALGDPSHPERRNAARSALAALAAPSAATHAAVVQRVGALAASDPDPDVRILATSALGESGNSAALPPLKRALADTNPNVAAAAADALGSLAVPEALDALQDAAAAGDLWVRIAAVVALGRLQDARAVPVLARTTAEPLLAEAAATALGAIGDPKGLAPLSSLLGRDHPARNAALSAAVRIVVAHPELHEPPAWLRATLQGDEAGLAERLSHGDETAAHLLGLAGTPEAARHLAAALDGARAPAAAAGLALLPESVAAGELVRHLEAAASEVRAALLAALPPLSEPGSIRAVARCLADPSPETRAAAIDALGRCEPDVVLPVLVEELDAPASRHAVALAFARVGAERCAPLTALLDDSDADVRLAAARGLVNCATPDVRERIAEALAREPVAGVRYSLVEALGTTGGADAVRAIEPLLSDPDPGLNFAALGALGRTRASEALAPLLRALSSPGPELRAAALRALGELGDASATEPLAEHLDAQDPDLRLTAALALRELAEPRALAYVLRALDDPAWPVRHAAVRTLARIGGPEVIERLQAQAAIERDPLVRDAARQGLERLAHDASSTPEATNGGSA